MYFRRFVGGGRRRSGVACADASAEPASQARTRLFFNRGDRIYSLRSPLRVAVPALPALTLRLNLFRRFEPGFPIQKVGATGFTRFARPTGRRSGVACADASAEPASQARTRLPNPKTKPVQRTGLVFGRGDRIRTCDILLPKQTLYQAEPRPDAVLNN